MDKDPLENLDYGFDWKTWLGTDTIASSNWTVDTGITVGTSTNDATSTTIWLSGGVAGTSYKAVNKITTAAGRVAERTLVVIVNLRNSFT